MTLPITAKSIDDLEEEIARCQGTHGIAILVVTDGAVTLLDPRQVETRPVDVKFEVKYDDPESPARDALREEFLRILPDLDYEVCEGTWAWEEHPWRELVGMSYAECLAVVSRMNPEDDREISEEVEHGAR